MKIGVVSEFYYPLWGGVSEHIRAVGNALKERGHDVTVITSHMRGESNNLGPRVLRLGRSVPVRYNNSLSRFSLGWRLGGEMKALLELPLLRCSAQSGLGIAALQERMRGRVCALVGHSGVGKSSLVNALAPEIEAETGAVNQVVGRGRHTTVSSALYELPGAIGIIDTPGIRAFGLWRVEPEHVADAFPELAEHSPACRYHDCRHLEEPEADCAVKRAVGERRAHALAAAADHAQPGAGIDQVLAHLGGAADEQYFDPFLVEVGGQLVLRNGLSSDRESGLLQGRLAGRADAVVGVNAFLAHPCCCAKCSMTSTRACTLSSGRALYMLAR